jgi:hypothetical protein
MPKYTVKPGRKLVVTDPDRPGQTIDKLGGDEVELDADAAESYADALDLVHEPGAANEPPAQ